jgi:transposase
MSELPPGSMEGWSCYPQRSRRLEVSSWCAKRVADEFGIAESCRGNWLRAAEVEDGVNPETLEQSTELRELRRRNRLLEQENEVLRPAAAYLSQANLPGK